MPGLSQLLTDAAAAAIGGDRPRLVAIGQHGDPATIPATLEEALARLTEAEETLRAIGAGEVDALVVNDVNGQSVFTLSSADRLYRMFVERMRDGAATLSSEGLILYANDRLAELLARPIDQIVGSPVADFVLGDLPVGLAAAGDGSGAGATVELDLLGPDGDPVPVLVGASQLDVDGDHLACLTFTDLRAQKALEEQLRQAQRMEAIGSLAAGIAHDFNNVLTVILGYGSVVVRNSQGGAREAGERIGEAADHAAELTAHLLAFSRQQILQPEVLDANAVVADALRLLQRLLGADIAVKRRLDPELAPTLVDRSQLGQVILNLALNARDAMPRGGSLAIRTANVELDDAYATEHPDVVPGSYVLLEVADSGQGMDEATRLRVFDPFFTTKAEGTGLGLSTVYGIVKQSGGHASVASELGVGTTFTVHLPTTDEPLLPPVDPVESLSPEGTETILVVEDAAQIRGLLTEVLGSFGYTVLAAADGLEALELVADEGAPTVDLVVTDVVMPLMDGREVADRLAAFLPGLPVLFTSGYPADAMLEQGIAEGRHAFMQKPYRVDELALKIREMLAVRRAAR